jgi:hypothetical protein
VPKGATGTYHLVPKIDLGPYESNPAIYEITIKDGKWDGKASEKTATLP